MFLCFSVVGVNLLTAESVSDQFPFIATATVVARDVMDDGPDHTFSLPARDARDCIDNMKILAGNAASYFQSRDLSVELSCVEKISGRVMLYVERGSRRINGCRPADPACSSGRSFDAID